MKKNCHHEVLMRRHRSYWWVCYFCKKSLSPEDLERLRSHRRVSDVTEPESLRDVPRSM